MARIRLVDLSLGYAGEPVVRRLDGVFAAGQATAVVGPNGSGKSTLIKALAGLIAPMAGRVVIEGASRREVAYLAQGGGVDRDFPISVEDLVALGFERRLGLFGGVGPAERARLAAAIAAVGLTGLERRPIGALSGGQLQRALFARVMVQDAPVILLDEPFSGLDVRTTAALGEVVRGWAAEGRTVLVTLHDLALARRLCGQALVFARQVVAWGPCGEALTPAHIETARKLADAWPGLEAA
ncbi:MAG: ATP-binding cassette domain-containing protein [Caulobacteraceae bacterium]|nr:ATP-binding cassette domain-containing protein [Caulobacteraceae bacterium]